MDKYFSGSFVSGQRGFIIYMCIHVYIYSTYKATVKMDLSFYDQRLSTAPDCKQTGEFRRIFNKAFRTLSRKV